MRGCLTSKIQEIAKKRIGREISQTELRLIPYIQYTMVNEQRVDPNKLNQDDLEILQKWRSKDLIEGGVSGLSITKEFWEFMCKILWEAYVVGGASK